VALNLLLGAQPIAEVRISENIKNYGHTLKSSANESWVLWNDSAAYGYDIYAQKYDGLGNAAFAAPIPIVTSNGSVKLMNAVATSDNGIVLTFMEEDEDDGWQVALKVQKINSQGLPQWTDNGIIVRSVSDIKRVVSKICANNLGGAFVAHYGEGETLVFLNYDGAGNNVWTADNEIDFIGLSGSDQLLLTDAGDLIINIHSWQATYYLRKVDNFGNIVGNLPIFAPDAIIPEGARFQKSINGKILIYSAAFNRNEPLSMQMMDADGNLLYDTLKLLHMGEANNLTGDLKISSLSDGGFILAFCSDSEYSSQPKELRVQRLSAALQPVWGSENPLILTGDQTIINSDLVVDSSDHAWLTTLRASTGFDLMQVEMVKLNQDGTTAFAPQMVGSQTRKKWFPRYSLLTDKAMLCWSDHLDDQVSMRRQIFTATGDQQFPEIGAPIASKLAGEAVIYGVYNLGNRTVCLMHDTRRNNQQIYYQILDNDMNPYMAENGQALDSSNELPHYVLAAKVSPQNTLFIVYQNSDPDSREIYLQEVDADGNLQYPAGGILLAPSTFQTTAALGFADDSCYVYWTHKLDVYNSRGIIKGQKIVNGAPVWEEGGIELYNNTARGVASIDAQGRYLVFKCLDTADGHWDSRALYIQPTGDINPDWDPEGVLLFDSTFKVDALCDVQTGMIQNDLYCIAQSYKQYGEYYLRAQKLDTSGNILWGDEGLQICYSDLLMPILRTAIFTDQIDILYHNIKQGVFLQKIDAEGNLGFGDHGISTPSSYSAQLIKYANDSYSYFWLDPDFTHQGRLMHVYINSGGSFQESQILRTAHTLAIHSVNCDNSAAIYWDQDNTDFLSIEESGIGLSIYATALNEPIANADSLQEPVPMVSLSQNSPNPFTGSTRISCKLLKASPVKLQIFNIKGQLVHELQAPQKAAGEYSWDWDGTDLRGQKCAGGIYLYKINADAHSVSKKMVLLK